MSRLREYQVTVVAAEGYSPEQARREAEDWLGTPEPLSDHVPLTGVLVAGGMPRGLPASVASIADLRAAANIIERAGA